MVTPLAERSEQQIARHKHSFSAAALVFIYLLAFAARLVGISLFVTPDEDNWMRRAGNFAEALETHDLRRTFQSGHPGVTTMWVAHLGMGAETSRLAGVTVQDWPVTREPGFMDLLVRARLAMIAVNSLLLVGMVMLAWRLLGAVPALIGGVLLALDPFLVAHSQVVHVDALSMGLITVSMLAAGVYWWSGGRVGYLVLCGAAAGLAVLTKAPSLVLGLLVPIVALTAPWVDPERWSWRRAVNTLTIAGLLGVAMLVALWPSMWVAPVETVERAIAFTLATSAEHRPGNFFMGRAVADPGPFFYPVAIMFRLSPLVLGGLVALAVLLPPRALKRPTILLLVLLFGFIAFLSLAGKKLDRYTLPAFPAMGLLAGLGLWTLWLWLAEYLKRFSAQTRRLAVAGGVALLVVLQALPLISVYPYALAYYSPLVGGGPNAARTLLVGWGEGLDQVAAYLNAQPDAQRQLIAVYFPLELNFAGMTSGTVTQFGDTRPVNYIVDYVNAAQRNQTPPEVSGLQPVHEVWINGIRYARIYHLDPPRRTRPSLL